ncbi:PREDICTED: odorant receptor 49b-like [Trachymyrmex septentrionalis]|uniref:odorant receptor 49b-like n=1 Tax=Trachymyrmex septentrionalis TaxID=34720 RepID=UPI00084F506D|nr:PREDICTED: odorant receptor 49b-like [Trachymyrmex septentrionalis]
MFFCLAQMLVVSLCFNFVRIFQIILTEKANKEALLPVIFAIILILYMFLSNFIGQNITDHNNYVFATVYRIEWYITPLYIQKMILFLLIKGAKNFYLSIGGLFDPSLECFATLVKASVSYFTVILSTQ